MFQMLGWLTIAGTGVAAVMVIVGTMQAQTAAVLRVVLDSRQISRDRELHALLDEIASSCRAPEPGWDCHTLHQACGAPISRAIPVNAELLQFA